MAPKRSRVIFFSTFPPLSTTSLCDSAIICSPLRASLCKTYCAPIRASRIASCSLTSLSLTASAKSIANASPNVPAPRMPLVLASKVIGVLVLVGSVLYKVPQLLRIVRRRSARGISVLMYALETLGMMFSAVYFARQSYPFVTYGETVFIIFTNLAILTLMVRYKRFPLKLAIPCSVVFMASVAFLVSPIAPLNVLKAMQVASIPLLNLAKVPQILLNHKCKSTGELAPSTLALQLLGNIARIFTTLVQVRDGLMLASILVAGCFNVTLFGQWLYYNTGTRGSLSNKPAQ